MPSKIKDKQCSSAIVIVDPPQLASGLNEIYPLLAWSPLCNSHLGTRALSMYLQFNKEDIDFKRKPVGVGWDGFFSA
jgi:hypothetical protein